MGLSHIWFINPKRMSKNKSRVATILLLVALIMSACVSLDSVSTTGKVAQKIVDHKDMYHQTIDVCDYFRVLSFSQEFEVECSKYKSSKEVFSHAIIVLTRYGKALEKIADDSDFKTDDQIDLIISSGESAKWFEFDDSRSKAAKKVASAVQTIVVNSVKRKGLRRIITSVNDDIGLVCDSLVRNLQNRDSLYDKSLKLLSDKYNADENSKPLMRELLSNSSEVVKYNSLDMALLLNLKSQFILEQKKCREAIRAILAFKLSHQKLRDEIDKVGTKDDLKVAKEIVEELKHLYENFGGILEIKNDE